MSSVAFVGGRAGRMKVPDRGITTSTYRSCKGYLSDQEVRLPRSDGKAKFDTTPRSTQERYS
jgi:hypothetical protein